MDDVILAEKTVELDLPLILAGVEDDRDGCLTRLEDILRGREGILNAHVERDQTPVRLCLQYDPAQVGLAAVERLVRQTGLALTSRYHHDLLSVEGMDCSDCVPVLEHGLRRMEGVLAVEGSYPAQSVRVEYDSHRTSRGQIENRIRQLGYRVPAEGMRHWYENNRELAFSLTAGLLLLIGWASERLLSLPQPLSLACYLGAYLTGGYDIARHALHALRERRFDNDSLMVIASLGAAALGEFAEGALLLFLMSLAHVLEERALDRARNAIRAVGRRAPETALVRRGVIEKEVPADQVEIGEIVIVRPGVRVPVDGEVADGQSSLDQSPVTGESIPVDKSPGDPVFAGSVNGEGALEVRVKRLARDSTLARVMRMVEEAQTHKAPTQQITERFSRVFVPVVLMVDLLIIALPPLFGVPLRTSFLRGMTLLVAASPCALALGTPATILAGLAQAARRGVLIKGGAHLENLGRIRAMAFDKTGTITRGQPEVTDVVEIPALTSQLPNGRRVLALAAAVQKRSAHPLARAVVDAAATRGLALEQAEEAKAATGRGMAAVVAGQAVWVGRPEWVAESDRDSLAELQTQVEALEGQGKTVMVVSLEGRPVGLIAVADSVRPEAGLALAALRGFGVKRTIMLTGDNPRAAGHIAGQVGLAEFRAGLMPEAKVSAIRALRREFGDVAMIGDGVNDAPALASATVGIAMSGAGTDAALETADVALMADDLSRLPFAVGLGQATRRVILQNLALSVTVIAALILSSLVGLVTIGSAVVLHETATFAVVLNSLRLLKYD